MASGDATLMYSFPQWHPLNQPAPMVNCHRVQVSFLPLLVSNFVAPVEYIHVFRTITREKIYLEFIYTEGSVSRN